MTVYLYLLYYFSFAFRFQKNNKKITEIVAKKLRNSQQMKNRTSRKYVCETGILNIYPLKH